MESLIQVASTTMAEGLLRMMGSPVNNDFDPVHKLAETVFPSEVSDLTVETSLRMIIVRDPFERLLSAYKAR